MHAGRVLSEGTVAQIQADERVQEVYLGRTVDSAADTTADPTDSTSAEVG
jgi:urea transport system ATP-binding protein